MAKVSAPAAAVTRKPRIRKPSYYMAMLFGDTEPIIVVAANHKTAFKALLDFRGALSTDLIAAGKNGWKVIDTTVPSNQTTLTGTVNAAPP